MQIVYFSHGGGPLPILGDPGHQALVEFLRALPTRLTRPEAILVISAHWEEDVATLTGAARPPLFYDYYGFPPEAYEIEYPAAGNPELAWDIATLLEGKGIDARLDSERGFDHGMFIPLKLMYPQADIPTVQLSLLRGLDAGRHIAMGKALESLRRKNILVIGSGFSFHNVRAFSWGGANAPDPRNDAFQDWLAEACAGEMKDIDRERLLLDWGNAPSARYCHPREEHLLPLHVCAGLARGPGQLVFDDYILGKRAIGVLWQ
jgi:aromatic ring-opening dioxygenase catalytic subunit (LigB family)